MTNYHFTRGDESAIEVVIDGGGSEIATGVKPYITVPFDCYVEEASLEVDQSGSIVIDIWKCSYSDFDAGSTHPVDGDSITASAPPTIAAATKTKDTTLTGWTRQLTKGDILAPNVDSVTTCEFATLVLKVRKL